MFAQHENNQEKRNWILTEAQNMENLQEGGTFSKTVWLCLKHHISKFLAYIISVIDRYNNMDIILNKDVEKWKLNLWLSMFDLLEIPKLSTLSISKFTIVIPRNVNPSATCLFPFSFEVVEFFTTGILVLKEKRAENVNDVLTGLFRSTRPKMHNAICQALDISKLNVMKAFACDVVMMLFAPTLDEADVIKDVVFTVAKHLYEQARYKEGFTRGDEIAVAFFAYKNLEDKLRTFSKILQACPEVRKNRDSWIEKQKKESAKFILHVEAFKDVLKLLKDKTEKVNNANEWIRLLNMIRSIGVIYKSVTLEFDDKNQMKHVSEMWLPLSLLHLFLLHILPPFPNFGSSIESTMFEDHLNAIIHPAKMFCKALIRNDPRGTNFLRIVTNLLKMCCDEIELMLLIGWRNAQCMICQNKVKNPILLSCNDFGCEKCIEPLFSSSKDRKKCPICHKTTPNDFVPKPESLTQEQKDHLKKFRSNCTIFYMKYLKQFCFKRRAGMVSTQLELQIKLLLKELVAQIQDEDRNQLQTAGLDMNINAKSEVLKILCKQNPSLVIEEIDTSLQLLKGYGRQTLITVLLQYFEKNLLSTISKRKFRNEDLAVFWQDVMTTLWQQFLTASNDDDVCWSRLKTIAEIRCAISYLVTNINSVFENSRDLDKDVTHLNSFIDFGVAQISSDIVSQDLKDYFLKVGCHIFGTRWLCKLAEHNKFKNLIPKPLLQAAETHNTDYWSLLGNDYIDAKANLYDIDCEDLEGIDGFFRTADDSILTKLLATLFWLESKDMAVRQRIMNAIERTIGENLLTKSMEFLHLTLRENVPPQHPNHVIYQLVILVAAAASNKNEIMNGFFTMMTTPSQCQNCFLPAMPEDLFFATPEDFRSSNMSTNSMYKCPNGHLYSIGQCTRPAQIARCPECHTTIGGIKHAPAQGNMKITLTPESQRGYKRDSNDGRSSHARERISPQGAAVVKFILHSSILIGLQRDRVTISRMVGCRDVHQALEYLIMELNNNLQDLSRSLSINLDDAILILFKILFEIIGKSPANYRENWLTMEQRKQWEQKFRQHYILPIFQNIEQEIIQAQNIMRQAEDDRKAPLNRLMHDEPTLEELDMPFNNSDISVWHYIAHPNLDHLSQKLSDSSDTDDGKVLKLLIQAKNLHFVKHLEHVLQLQHILIERYSQQIDMKDSDKKTFRDHISEHGSEDEKVIKKYIMIWNMLLPTLRIRIPEKLQNYAVELSKDSPISNGLPSTRGRGQFAKFFAEYLIKIQNDFLSNCSLAVASTTHDEVEVGQLVSADTICFEQHDLISLVYKHSNYDIISDENGKHHRILYNIDALEKQIREKFVFHKKQIKVNTLPIMKYPQDFGIGSDWETVGDNIYQEPLTAKLIQDVDRIAERSLLSEICEGVRTLSDAISILAMVKSDASQPLCAFLERDLQLSSSKTSMIPKSANIKHILALYQRLSWHKAVTFVQQGLEPYKGALSGIDQENIPAEIDILEALERTDIAKLQQRINEMMINMPELDRDWSLAEDIFPNIQFLDRGDEDDSWYCNLPVDLCCKHISDLFSYTVHHFDTFE